MSLPVAPYWRCIIPWCDRERCGYNTLCIWHLDLATPSRIPEDLRQRMQAADDARRERRSA